MTETFTRRRVSFTVPGVPQPKGSTRLVPVHGRPTITSDNPRLKGWERDVGIFANVAQAALRIGHGRQFTGPLSLTLAFYLPRPSALRAGVVPHVRKPDLDKLIRAIKDALTGVLYQDDAQVVEICATKAYATGLVPPSVDITLIETGGHR